MCDPVSQTIDHCRVTGDDLCLHTYLASLIHCLPHSKAFASAPKSGTVDLVFGKSFKRENYQLSHYKEINSLFKLWKMLHFDILAIKLITFQLLHNFLLFLFLVYGLRKS